MPMTLISRQTLTGTAASVTFNNIPQTFQTLKLVVSSRTDRASQPSSDIIIRFNTDSSSSYSFRRIYGNGASTASDNLGAGANNGLVILTCGASATTSTFGNAEVTIPNYFGSFNKAISTDSVSENNATTAFQSLNAALWALTPAISSIALSDYNSANFVSGSTFSLYGIS